MRYRPLSVRDVRPRVFGVMCLAVGIAVPGPAITAAEPLNKPSVQTLTGHPRVHTWRSGGDAQPAVGDASACLTSALEAARAALPELAQAKLSHAQQLAAVASIIAGDLPDWLLSRPKKKQARVVARVQAAHAAALANCKSAMATAAAGGVTAKAASATLQSAPLLSGAPSYNGPDGCFSSARVVCPEHFVTHVLSQTFELTTTGAVTVSTHDLASVRYPTWGAGPNEVTWAASSPDTVLVVARCDTGDCVSGQIIDINDDSGGTLASRIDFTASQTGTYLVLVFGYGQGGQGTTTVRVERGGSPLAGPFSERVFGGRRLVNKALKAKDQVFIGRNNDGANADQHEGSADDGYALPGEEYHDSMLWVLERGSVGCASLSGGCGSFVARDDTTWGGASVLLSSVKIPAGWDTSTSTILTGVYHDAYATPPDGVGNPTPAKLYYMSQRLFHLRRHTSDGGDWTGAEQIDRDDDGLSEEIERALGSCESAQSAWPTAVGFAGASCADFATHVDAAVETPATCTGQGNVSNPECWSERDSDNDGIEDGWEVFAAAFACDHPPQGPMGRMGQCTPLGIHDSDCPAGKTCLAEPLSARSDPDPTVYDIYVEHVSSTCDGDLESNDKSDHCLDTHTHTSTHGAEHTLHSAQQDALRRVFSEQPLTCWDGSLGGAGPTQTCPLAGDRRYFANLHAYEGQRLHLRDDTAGDELQLGTFHTAALYATRFGGARRYGGLFRMVYGHHQGHLKGVARRVPGLASRWRNHKQEDRHALFFAHELGHTLGLHHGHVAEGQSGGQNGPFVSKCWLSDATCAPLPASCGAGACPAGVENPLQHSVMSYQTADGMATKGAPVPSTSNLDPNSLCSWEAVRFSKGLGVSLGEGAISETLSLATHGDHARVTAQGMACYIARTAVCTGGDQSRYGFEATATQSVGGVPYCDGTDCYVNWDQTGTTPATQAYAHDLSRGIWDPQSGSCQETLAPVDEWQQLFARAKTALFKQRMDDEDVVQDRYSVYLETFNHFGTDPGAWTQNQAGWHMPVSVGGPLVRDTKPLNRCDTAADCGAGVVCGRDDGCTASASTCRVPGEGCDTSSGTCKCQGSDDCFSGSCVNQRCVPLIGPGYCKCDVPAYSCMVPEGGDQQCTDQVCNETELPAGRSLGVSEAPYDQHLQLRGPGFSDGIGLDDDNGSPMSPLRAFHPNMAGWSLRLDLWLALPTGSQTSIVIFQSSFFRLSMEKDPQTGAWGLSGVGMGGSGQPLGDPLVLGPPGFTWLSQRWVRIDVQVREVAGAGYEGFIQARPWNIARGSYGQQSAGACVKGAVNAPPTHGGSVYLGYDGVAHATSVTGRMDNISLTAAAIQEQAPSHCVAAP